MRIATVLVGVGLMAMVGLAQATADSTTHVHIVQFDFDPTPITILLGDEVQWDNHDSVAHTVTSDDGSSFDSGTLADGATYTRTFDGPGTFHYHCSFHPAMKATVVVIRPDAQPDLVVDVVTATETLPGLAHEVTVQVTNAGGAGASASTLVVRYASAEAEGEVGTIALPSLLPGEHVVVSTDWATLGKLGEFTITAEADATELVVELDEGNNARSTSAAVLVAGVEGQDLLAP